MDLELKAYRSLPPFVEGKVHGYLTLVIDEIVWSKRSPGNITVLASWWGEIEDAKFRPVDITSGIKRFEQDTTKVYAIKTNISLFEEYIKNCETIELIVIDEKTNEIIATGQITDLLEILDRKTYFKYFPIYDDSGNRLGELHVSMKLLNLSKYSNTHSKPFEAQKTQNNKDIYPFVHVNMKTDQTGFSKYIDSISSDESSLHKTIKPDPMSTYKSILKTKRANFQDPVRKLNLEVTDNLVAQVVARAQKLRGAILRETWNEDSLIFSDSSANDSCHNNSVENEAKLYEYFLGNEMSIPDQHKALDVLRSMSPTPSLLDLASKTIKTCEHNKSSILASKMSTKTNDTAKKVLCNKENEISEGNQIDNIRFFIESFVLSPAGYRRVKSSCLSRNEYASMSVTFFVQYDVTSGYIKQANKKAIHNNKPIRICSKRQIGEVVYFNHESIYDISKSNMNSNIPIQFKILVRHFNQKSHTELGIGSVYMNDIIKTGSLNVQRHLAIINRGMKVGELKVSMELGHDLVYLAKQCTDSITSTKENIPVLQVQSLLRSEADKYRNVTGTHSKTASKISSVSSKRIDSLSSDESSELVSTAGIANHREQNLDDKKIGTKDPESNSKSKVLLQGLIYIAEGRDLSELNTYLICRAFWKEDKATSQLCTNTKNPFYHFCQVVPLIHGTDLLERIKDNYIIIEVYCRNNSGVDNLLGIAKLPVHQLYVAYRDPLVLPQLLLSKYPVISVDGWVTIVNPVTAVSCGQLLALVALGTAEQIALLETSRGLRNITNIQQTTSNYTHNFHTTYTNHLQNIQQMQQYSKFDVQSDPASLLYHGGLTNHTFNIPTKDPGSMNVKSQEIQTDISTIKESKLDNISAEAGNKGTVHSDQLVLHALVDQLAQALSVHKSNAIQETHTQNNIIESEQMNAEHSKTISCNTERNGSRIGSPQNNFDLPTEMYRSVGVGAELDESLDQQASSHNDNTIYSSPVILQTLEKDEMDSNCDNTFRALVEIDCAFHLPKVEQSNEVTEPSTYVTFYKNQTGFRNHPHSCMITNVVPRNCNPKWNWKCDVRLSTDLLINNGKRLILKVWRLFDPNVSEQPDLEKDIVIGFSAIDLSVLSTGFPAISGWFHIMDFTGKCNGQLKVTVTPLDNLSSFAVSNSASNIIHTPISYVSSPTSISLSSQGEYFNDHELNNICNSLSVCTRHHETKSVQNEQQLTDTICSLEDTSMSFLSLSLKQKLTELDEITKRLQSRLRDVTNNAFEDDFETDFDLNESSNDNEDGVPKNIPTLLECNNEKWKTLQSTHKVLHTQTTRKCENHPTTSIDNVCNRNSGCNNNAKKTISDTVNNTIHTAEISQTSQQGSLQSDYSTPCQNGSPQLDNLHSTGYKFPARGSRAHINHLLDKLSLNPPPLSTSCEKMPTNEKVVQLLKNVQCNNVPEKNVPQSENNSFITVSSEAEDRNDKSSQTLQNRTLNCANFQTNIKNSGKTFPDTLPKLQPCNRISSVIREELIEEEANDNIKCDDLTTYLITSNVRHMDLDTIFNPLLYSHLGSDIHISNTVSPEGEAIEQLDNRYVNSFNSVLNSGLSRLQNLAENNILSESENISQNGNGGTMLQLSGSTELVRLTPTGVSENINGKIDATVAQESGANDHTASNGPDSPIAISMAKSLEKQTEVDLNGYSYSTLSESSACAVSRQAPDGGNPVEESTKPISNPQDACQKSSAENFKSGTLDSI